MTDTYVEKLIVKKILTLESLEQFPKCYQYFQEHKTKDTVLTSFDVWKPHYPDGTTDDEKAKIDGPIFLDFLDWYQNRYIDIYKTEDASAGWSQDDDDLFTDIKNSSLTDLTTNKTIVKIYDSTGNKKDYPMFPNVAFPNSDFTRPVDSNGNNTYWYELYFIPAPPIQIELGTKGRNRWVGIMQVNICVPKTWGVNELYDKYDELAFLFRSGTIFDGVRITRTYRESAVNDEDYYCLPVTIDWVADLDR